MYASRAYAGGESCGANELCGRALEDPDSAKDLKFTPGSPEAIATSEISDKGTAVLPFLRKIAVRAATGTELAKLPLLYLCLAPRGRPDELACNVPEQLSAPVLLSGTDHDRYSYALPDAYYLEAGRSYQLCSGPSTGGSMTRCNRFDVSVPYFQSCALGDCQKNEYDKPYVFIPGKAVIFGVVDPDLNSLVGRDNLSWENSDKGLKTEVAALEPLKSLLQARQRFESDYPGEHPIKILLAQMGRAKAEELAENLDFDVVIAAARPYEHATTNRRLALEPKPNGEGGAKYRGVVVVPWRVRRVHWMRPPMEVARPAHYSVRFGD